MDKSNIIQIKKRSCLQPFVVAGCIIEKNGKILLVREGKKWNQPSGWVELREDIISAAKREAEEETGLEVSIKNLLGIYTLVKQKNDNILHAIKFIFIAKLTGRKLESTENIPHQWFDQYKIKTMKEQLWDQNIIEEVDDLFRGKYYPLEVLENFKDLSIE